jgi:hypothetical protein
MKKSESRRDSHPSFQRKLGSILNFLLLALVGEKAKASRIPACAGMTGKSDVLFPIPDSRFPILGFMRLLPE